MFKNNSNLAEKVRDELRNSIRALAVVVKMLLWSLPLLKGTESKA